MATNEELRLVLGNGMFRRYWDWTRTLRNLKYNFEYEMTQKFILIYNFLDSIKRKNKGIFNNYIWCYELFAKEYQVPKQKCILLILQDRGVL